MDTTNKKENEERKSIDIEYLMLKNTYLFQYECHN